MPDGSQRIVPGGSTIKASLPLPPTRQYSFTDNSTNNPTSQQPGNYMDAEYDRTNQSVGQLISFVSVTFNTDGSLIPGSVGLSELDPSIVADMTAEVENAVQPLVTTAQNAAQSAQSSATAAATSATSAQTANNAAQGAAGNASASQASATASASAAQASATGAANSASAAANSANDADGDAALCTDYAAVCQAWAEYMPDTIPPNILAVMNITGDHWSSRWWANQASTTVSTVLDELDQALNDALDQIQQAGEYWLGVLQDQTNNAIQGIQSFYLGAFYSPPVTDSLGNTIATGAMYFDLTLDAAYVWNGTAWRPLVTPGPAAIFRYVYVATAGQTVFEGADRNNNTFTYDAANYQTVDVFHKGLLLTPVNDYTEAVNQITLTTPCGAGDIVQLQVCTIPTVALDWQTIRLDTSGWSPAGGVLKNAADGSPVTPNAPSDVMVSVDGVWQQGQVDYTIAGDLLTFTTPTQLDARVFGLVIAPTQSSTVPVPALTVIDTSGWVFDGTATAFLLKATGTGAAVSPQADVNLLVSLNGVWQAATLDYSVTASTVTFTTAPQPYTVAFAVAGLPALMST